MNKRNLLSVSVIIMATMPFISCVTKRYGIYSPEETNLQSLNKITDNEDNKFDTPFGGDNGQNLFFAVRDKRGSSNIYRKENPVSAAMSPKTDGKNINSTPSFCAVSNQIAYAGRQEGAFVNDIFMMDASQGAAIRRLTNTPNEAEFYPFLSADGKSVVYEKIYMGAMLKDAQIWKQDLQTESPTLLCQGRMPSFSHDGRSIAFVRFTPDGENTCLVVMDTNGQNQTELTDAKMGIVGMPRFSPDDTQIIFQCRKKDKKDYDLYVINRDGTALTQLTFNKSYDAEPYWANDGYIYFSSDRGGRPYNFQIWRFKYKMNTPTTTPVYSSIQQPVYTNTPTTSQPIHNTGIYHTVQNGETITVIARLYGVTVKDIVKWNELMTMTITPGMKLKVSAQ